MRCLVDGRPRCLCCLIGGLARVACLSSRCRFWRSMACSIRRSSFSRYSRVGGPPCFLLAETDGGWVALNTVSAWATAFSAIVLFLWWHWHWYKRLFNSSRSSPYPLEP